LKRGESRKALFWDALLLPYYVTTPVHYPIQYHNSPAFANWGSGTASSELDFGHISDIPYPNGVFPGALHGQIATDPIDH
jgi:hypothetical protein